MMRPHQKKKQKKIQKQVGADVVCDDWIAVSKIPSFRRGREQ